MLRDDPRGGHLGPVQFGSLDVEQVPAHVLASPSPSIPSPTVFPVSQFTSGGIASTSQASGGKGGYGSLDETLLGSPTGRHQAISLGVGVNRGYEEQVEQQRGARKSQDQERREYQLGAGGEHLDSAAPLGEDRHVRLCAGQATIGQPKTAVGTNAEPPLNTGQPLYTQDSIDCVLSDLGTPVSGDLGSQELPHLSTSHITTPSSPRSSEASPGNVSKRGIQEMEACEAVETACGPKVVVAIPSSSHPAPSVKKTTWATIASKPPKRVPYITQATGTIPSVPQYPESIVSSHLLTVSTPSGFPGGKQQRAEGGYPHEGSLGCRFMIGTSDVQMRSESYTTSQGAKSNIATHLYRQMDEPKNHRHLLYEAQTSRDTGMSRPSSPAYGGKEGLRHKYSLSQQGIKFQQGHVRSEAIVVGGMRRSVKVCESHDVYKPGGINCCVRGLLSSASPVVENGEGGHMRRMGRSASQTKLPTGAKNKVVIRCWPSKRSLAVVSGSGKSQKGMPASCLGMGLKTGNGMCDPRKSQEDDTTSNSVAQTVSQDITSNSACSSSSKDTRTAYSSGLHSGNQAPIFNTSLMPRKLDAVLGALCETEPLKPCRFYEQGITNLGNTCFLGSALQLLLSSDLFCGLLVQLEAVKDHLNRGRLPTLCALGELASKLVKRPHVGQGNGKGLDNQNRHGRTPHAIVPTMLSLVLDSFSRRISGYRGGPEEQDAQEFLLFLLEQIESEVQLVKQSLKGQEEEEPSQESDSEEWLIAGKKNKGSVRRTAGSTASNIVTSLFGGIIESQVRVKDRVVKDKFPSVTSHRFTALDLDIANPRVQTIDDALQLYIAKDTISDYRVEGCNRPVTAEKANLLSNLPPVLLISLKRYAFTAGGMEKIQKRIGFGQKLNILGKYMVAGEQGAQYELIATCSHHGRGHGGDHYTANVMQPEGYWVHFDDSTYQRVQGKEVANDTPYLMLYRKLATKKLSYR